MRHSHRSTRLDYTGACALTTKLCRSYRLLIILHAQIFQIPLESCIIRVHDWEVQDSRNLSLTYLLNVFCYGTVGTCSGLVDFVTDAGVTDTDLEDIGPEGCCFGADCPTGAEIIIGDGEDRRRALATERRLTLGGGAALAAGMENSLIEVVVVLTLRWCDGTNAFCLYAVLVTPGSIYIYICLESNVLLVICITCYDVFIVFIGDVEKIDGESTRSACRS